MDLGKKPLCAWYCARHFKCIALTDPQNSLKQIIPIFGWANWGLFGGSNEIESQICCPWVVLISRLCLFSFNLKMEKFQDCTKWLQFLWLGGGEHPFHWTLGSRCEHPRFYHFVVSCSCWRSVLQKKAYFVVLVSCSHHFPSITVSSSRSSCCLELWPTLRARGVSAVPSSVNCFTSQMLENYC